ncbi:MAG: hypothetical protein IKZ88_06400 [Neisseriaceae bacterium]|nr:hypothetical protein [Neisseriaceae bacterium]
MKNKKRSKEEILLLEIISQYLHNPQNNTVEKTVYYHDRKNLLGRNYSSFEIKITAQVREFIDD